ncbi:SOS response-associated peptidase [Polaribacter sp. R77954]|uniref:SOS response-associated peptidase n=1 Tax=Polaribacter sp. R77954 TaxID=3093870 RepID=UPI0037C6E15A
MCYDIKASKKAQLKRAIQQNDSTAINEIEEDLIPYTDLPLYHSSGFQHHDLLIYTDDSPDYPTVATWGLIPHWVKDDIQMKKTWNTTLNARGETIFEKPSFRSSANNKRCLIYVDGFYEHHHYNNKTYPFYIFKKDKEPLILAGLWSEWKNPETNIIHTSFGIVTTKANGLMSKIHNNPKLKEPRMPFILPDSLADNWLNPINNDLDKKQIQEMIQSFPEDKMSCYTVGKLRGKDYAGNVKSISNEFLYENFERNF